MLLARRVAAIGVLVCFHATWACSARLPASDPIAVPQPISDPTTPDPAGEPTVSEPLETDAPTSDPDACALVAAPGDPITTVALGDAVDPANAPRPSNDSERLLFRQVYETLVSADCLGRVVPALAASWRLDADGRTWIVTLREDAQFSDGTPVTAAEVRASWLRDASGDALHAHVNRLVETIVPVGDRALAIRLHSGRQDMPVALAHPDLAVAKVRADSAWPLGTRGARIEPGADAVPAAAASAITVVREHGPAIRFLVGRGDPRDLLDHGVDILLTRDPGALGYAATLPQFVSVPLTWQRTYVLLTPGRSREAPPPADDARQRLAEDAVRGEARGAQGPFWWQTWEECRIAALSPFRNQPSALRRIVYDAGDGVARDLAERFVGLGRAPGAGGNATAFNRAAGLTGAALRAARRRGADAGYILSLDSRPLDSCRELYVLLESAPWIDPATIVPLVETRVHAVLRRGVSGATVAWDAGLLLRPHAP